MAKWGLAVIGAALILVGSALAAFIQTSGGSVEVRDVRYRAEDGALLSGLLYIPKTATATAPAPAILVSHGLINTREMQSPFAIELSRRGYVVLAMDMSGHGYSQGTLGQNGAGGPAAFAYLARQPFVDKSAIGLEGHSLGGAPILAAAKANPDGYRAMVLEGSSTSIGGRGRPGATPFSPRNLAVVFGQYDEFPTMWQVKKGSDLPTSVSLKRVFGVTDPVEPGRLYGSIADGTARLLVLPPVNHPQEHFTKVGVGGALDWFARTIPGAKTQKPTSDQVWLWKEFGTLAGFAGCVLLILGAFRLLLETRLFAPLRMAPTGGAEKRDPRWWLAFVLTAAIPALTYYPIMEKGQAIFFSPFGKLGVELGARGVFSQQVTNQLVVWALANGLIGLVLSFVLKSGKNSGAPKRWGLSLLAAVASVGVGYLSLALVDAVFKVDYRFWVLGLKPLDGAHFVFFLTYLLPFTLFFVLSLRSFAASLPVKGESTVAAVLFGGIAMSLGFIVMLVIQYGSMLSNGVLFHDNALLTIVAYQFVPLLFVIGAIAAVTWRLTGSYAPGAFICALFITWYIVAGTATYPARIPPPPGAAASPAVSAPVPAPKAP